MAEMDRMTTPYAYAFDNPIRHTDPDGMFGEDAVEDFDQEGPGKGAKAATAIAVTSPGIGSAILEGVKDIGVGMLRAAGTVSLSAGVGALALTGALVITPQTGTGAGSDNPKPFIVPPPLIPPGLKKETQDNASGSKPNQTKKQNRRADAEHTSNKQEKNRNKHEDARARKDREQAKADERYNDTRSKKKDTRSNNQKKKENPNYKRTEPKTE